MLPRFVGQITGGKPLTLTDPEMTRFLLPLPQAVELVEFAFEHAVPGDVFIRKAPACTMGDLAAALVHLFRASNPIEVIGTRHGEKVYETLATREELRRADDLGSYLQVHMDGRELDYERYLVHGDQGDTVEEYTSHNTRRLKLPEIEELLSTLPEIRAHMRPGEGA